jgi:hypothetical protein
MAYLDLLSIGNHIMINTNIAKVFGLNTAAYWGELLNVLSQVQKKKTYNEEGYFKLHRKYMEEKTTLTTEEQKECEEILSAANVLMVCPTDKNSIRVNVRNMVSLIAEGKESEIEKISTMARGKTKKTKAETTKACVRNALVNGLFEPVEEVKEAYTLWIDSILAVKKPLSNAIRDLFVKELNAYTDNPAIKIAIIETAIKLSYTNATWVIQQWEKSGRQVDPTRLQTQQKQPIGLNTNQTF